MDQAVIIGAIRRAARLQRRALSVWYPQTGPNAPAERNYTVHLGICLQRVPGTQIFAEATIGTKAGSLIDLAAYHHHSETLVAVEAKRFLQGGNARRHVDDEKKVRRFWLVKKYRGAPPPPVARKFCVLLTSTQDGYEGWWQRPDRLDDSPTRSTAWREAARMLSRIQARGGELGAEPLTSHPSARRSLLWAVWPEPV